MTWSVRVFVVSETCAGAGALFPGRVAATVILLGEAALSRSVIKMTSLRAFRKRLGFRRPEIAVRDWSRGLGEHVPTKTGQIVA